MFGVTARFQRTVRHIGIWGVTAVVVAGCQAVSLSNRTNQPEPSSVSAYDPTVDVFTTGAEYVFRLRVNRESSTVPWSSIAPVVVVNGTPYPMNQIGEWEDGSSQWKLHHPDQCPDVGFADEYGFHYSFVVNYERNSPLAFLVASPPAEIPATGSFHARVLNAGTLHFSAPEATYPQECWETNLGCVPTWETEVVIGTDVWPGSPSDFEHTLTLRNLTQSSRRLLRVEIVSFQGNPPNPRFELTGVDTTAMPVDIPCEGTFTFGIRYTPGFTQDAGFTMQPYNEVGMIRTWVEGPNGQAIQGPFIYIDYHIIANPG